MILVAYILACGIATSAGAFIADRVIGPALDLLGVYDKFNI